MPPSDPIITYTVNNQFTHLDDYDQISLKENDNLDLKCFLKVKGNPSPNIHWLKNGIFFNNQSFLSLPKLTSFDHMDTYTCSVSHEALDDISLTVSVKLSVYCMCFLFFFVCFQVSFIFRVGSLDLRLDWIRFLSILVFQQKL